MVLKDIFTFIIILLGNMKNVVAIGRQRFFVYIKQKTLARSASVDSDNSIFPGDLPPL